MAIVKSESPEIFGFIDDLKLHIKTLKLITPTRQFLVDRQDMVHPDVLQYLELKEQLLLTYLYNMEYYFYIKALGQENVVNHPVMKQLLELRYAIQHMKKNDEIFQGALDALIRLRSCSSKVVKEVVQHPKFNKYLLRGLLPNEIGSDEESEEEEEEEEEEESLEQDEGDGSDVGSEEEEEEDYNDYLDEDEERFSAKPVIKSKKNRRRDALDDVGEYEETDIFAQNSSGGSDANMQELQRTLSKLVGAKASSKSVSKSVSIGDDTLAPLPGKNGRAAPKQPVQDDDEDDEDEDEEGDEGEAGGDDGNSSDDYDKFEARIDENEGFMNDYDDDDDDFDNENDEEDEVPRKRRRAPEAGNDEDVEEEEEENLLDLFSKKKKKFNELKKQHYSVAPRYGGAQEEALDGDKKRAASYEIMKNRGLTPHRKKSNRNPRVKKREMYKKAVIARKGQVREVVTGVGSAYGGELTGIKANIARSRKIHN